MKRILFVSGIALLVGGMLYNFVNAQGTAATVSQEVQTAIDNFRAAKQEFIEARRRAAQAEANNQVNDFRQTFADRMEHRKTTLLRILELHEKHLEKTKERVENMPNITDAQKAEAATAIDTALASITNLKTQVESAIDDGVLRSLITNVRSLLQEYHTTVKNIVQAIHASRLDGFLARALNRVSTLSDQLTELELNGQAVSALQTQLMQAQDLLTEAQADATGGELRSAIGKIKDAYALMRQVTQGIQSLNISE